MHGGGKPRRKYSVEHDPVTSEIVDVVSFDGELTSRENTLVHLYHHHLNSKNFICY